MNGYLERRHLNTAMQTEVPPQCAVTIGLLIALHHTAHGKNDVLDRVIEIDNHQWISDPTGLSKEDQEAMVKRCKKALYNRIVNILGKFTGPKGKERSRMLNPGQEPVDISRCLNCLLRDTYVPMPERGKWVVSRKKSTAHTKIDGVSALASTSLDEVVGHNFGHPASSTGIEK